MVVDGVDATWVGATQRWLIWLGDGVLGWVGGAEAVLASRLVGGLCGPGLSFGGARRGSTMVAVVGVEPPGCRFIWAFGEGVEEPPPRPRRLELIVNERRARAPSSRVKA